MLRRSKVPCPMVLGACDGLYRCELSDRGNLTHDTWYHNEEAPDQRTRATVVEGQANVAVFNTMLS